MRSLDFNTGRRAARLSPRRLSIHGIDRIDAAGPRGPKPTALGFGVSHPVIRITSFSEAPEAGAERKGLPTFEQIMPANLLDGDEIIILAIKPSLWFVVFTSFRWLLAVLAVMLLIHYWPQGMPFFNKSMVAQGAVAIGTARIGLALLQWVSRLYVLTNRRVLRLAGIFNIDLFECHLSKIQNTYVNMAWYERLFSLGTIAFSTAGSTGIEATWRNVNNPLEVHERIRAAINRTRRPGNGL